MEKLRSTDAVDVMKEVARGPFSCELCEGDPQKRQAVKDARVAARLRMSTMDILMHEKRWDAAYQQWISLPYPCRCSRDVMYIEHHWVLYTRRKMAARPDETVRFPKWASRGLHRLESKRERRARAKERSKQLGRARRRKWEDRGAGWGEEVEQPTPKAEEEPEPEPKEAPVTKKGTKSKCKPLENNIHCGVPVAMYFHIPGRHMVCAHVKLTVAELEHHYILGAPPIIQKQKCVRIKIDSLSYMLFSHFPRHVRILVMYPILPPNPSAHGALPICDLCSSSHHACHTPACPISYVCEKFQTEVMNNINKFRFK